MTEPSLFATDCAVVAPVAAGSRARSLIGRSPHYVSLHKPISNGAISEFRISGANVKAFHRKFLEKEFTSLVPHGSNLSNLRNQT